MRAKEWRQWILICILLVVAFGLLSLIWGLFDKAQVAINEAHNAQTQYQLLEERKAALEAKVTALNTERGKDAAVRTAFGVARIGEEVIVVVPPVSATSTPTLSWWQKVFNWFK